MTAAELIEELKKLPPGAVIYCAGCDGCANEAVAVDYVPANANDERDVATIEIYA